MRQFHLNRLRAHRKRWGFSQAEMAVLLGLKSATTVSKLELGQRHPTGELLIAMALLLNEPVDKLFPEFHAAVHAEALERARSLHAKLTQKNGATDAKKQLLLAFIDRASNHSYDSS